MREVRKSTTTNYYQWVTEDVKIREVPSGAKMSQMLNDLTKGHKINK